MIGQRRHRGSRTRMNRSQRRKSPVCGALSCRLESFSSWRWLLLIPVLQAELLQRRRSSLPDAEMERAAVLFSSAVLFGRSEGQALLFAGDGSESDIRSVLRVISERPLPSSQTRLQVTGVPCGQSDGDGCFVGRLLGNSTGLDSGIRFGLESTGNGPKVLWVELDLLSV